MAKVARKEKDIAVGLIRTGRTSVHVNDTPIATERDLIAPHTPGGAHTASVIIEYWPNVYAESRPVARKSDATSCGHAIQTGSSNVFVGTDDNN